MTPFQELLAAIHNAARFVLHVVLIPVIAGLKAIIAGLQYVHDEASKV